MMEGYEQLKAESEKFRPILEKFCRGEMTEKELDEELSGSGSGATTHLGNLGLHPLRLHPTDLAARTQLVDEFFMLCLRNGD